MLCKKTKVTQRAREGPPAASPRTRGDSPSVVWSSFLAGVRHVKKVTSASLFLANAENCGMPTFNSFVIMIYIYCLAFLSCLHVSQAQTSQEAFALASLRSSWQLSTLWLGDEYQACSTGWPGISCMNGTVTSLYASMIFSSSLFYSFNTRTQGSQFETIGRSYSFRDHAAE